MSLSPSPHKAISLPSTWLSEGNYTSFSQQKTTQLIGPVSDNVLLSASSNLTCINYYRSNYTGLKTPLPPSVPLRFTGTAQIITPTRNLHSLWDLCIFMSPLGPPWTLHLGLPDPRPNIPQRRRGRTNSLPPRGNFPTGKD